MVCGSFLSSRELLIASGPLSPQFNGLDLVLRALACLVEGKRCLVEALQTMKRTSLSTRQLFKGAAAELNESVARATVGHDDAAAAVRPPVFAYSFSPAPPRAIAVAPLTGISREPSSESESTGPAGTCWVCCEGGRSFQPLIPMGCACRGSAGLAHLHCLVEAALHNVESWTTCHVCRQEFTGEADVGLARARWERVRGRPEEDEERLFVANNLAVSLKESAGDNAGALRLMREVLAVRRRLGEDHPATLTLALALALA